MIIHATKISNRFQTALLSHHTLHSTKAGRFFKTLSNASNLVKEGGKRVSNTMPRRSMYTEVVVGGTVAFGANMLAEDLPVVAGVLHCVGLGLIFTGMMENNKEEDSKSLSQSASKSKKTS